MLDLGKINEAEAKIQERSKGGPSLFINVAKIDGELDIRLLDPQPCMGGLPYMEVPMWWIKVRSSLVPHSLAR